MAFCSGVIPCQLALGLLTENQSGQVSHFGAIFTGRGAAFLGQSGFFVLDPGEPGPRSQLYNGTWVGNWPIFFITEKEINR